MTNEEAIATLKYQHDYGRMEQEVRDALAMAIKALEQPEPCKDTISRAAAIYIASGYCAPANIASELAKLPSAQPEQRWIPCSERQPDVNGWYVTTISGEICGQDRAFSGMSEFANGKWMSGDDVDETEMTIAWMPLPEPYQEGEQE